MSDAMNAKKVIDQVLADRDGQCCAADILSALTTRNFVVVPRTLTLEMTQAVTQFDFSAPHDPSWQEYYSTILAAAPQP